MILRLDVGADSEWTSDCSAQHEVDAAGPCARIVDNICDGLTIPVHLQSRVPTIDVMYGFFLQWIGVHHVFTYAQHRTVKAKRVALL